MLRQALGIGDSVFSASIKAQQKFYPCTLIRHCSSNLSVIDDNCYKLLDSNDYQNIDTLLEWRSRVPDIFASDCYSQVDLASNHEFTNAIHYWDVEFDKYA